MAGLVDAIDANNILIQDLFSNHDGCLERTRGDERRAQRHDLDQMSVPDERWRRDTINDICLVIVVESNVRNRVCEWNSGLDNFFRYVDLKLRNGWYEHESASRKRDERLPQRILSGIERCSGRLKAVIQRRPWQTLPDQRHHVWTVGDLFRFRRSGGLS